MCNSLNEAKAFWWIPVAHRLRCSGKGGAFTETGSEPRDKQRSQTAGQPRSDRTETDNDNAYNQRQASAVFSCAPSSEENGRQIGPRKRAKRQAHFGVREAEMGFDRCGGRRDIHAIEIHDRKQNTEQGCD